MPARRLLRIQCLQCWESVNRSVRAIRIAAADGFPCCLAVGCSRGVEFQHGVTTSDPHFLMRGYQVGERLDGQALSNRELANTVVLGISVCRSSLISGDSIMRPSFIRIQKNL